MAGGQQANFGQGTLTPSTGEGEEALSGGAAASAHGLVGLNRFVPLRSRKVGGGEAMQALQGQAFSALQGQLRQAAARQLAGTQLLSARGNVIGNASGGVPGTDNWAERSAGALIAVRFNTPAQVAQYEDNDGGVGSAQFDPSPNGDGTSGSVLIPDMPDDNAPCGQVGLSFENVGEGQTVWFSYRIFNPPEKIFQPVYQPFGTQTAQKYSILANQYGTHGGPQTSQGIVPGNSDGHGVLGGYHWGGTAVTSWAGTLSNTNCGSVSHIVENMVDNGQNALVGVNPDTGLPWTPCEQDAHRYGGMHNRNSVSSTRVGIGDWLAGTFRMWPNEWITVRGRVIIGNFGVFNSRITIWAARAGQPFSLLIDKENQRLGGTYPASTDYNKLSLMGYCTFRVAFEGRKITGRTNNITGVDLYTLGGSTAVGPATLEYNASTKKFRFAAFGETFGPAVGFSVENNKLLRSARSSSDRFQTSTTETYRLPITSGVVNVVSTANFPNSGSFMVGGYALTYTGKTPTSFTGVSQEHPHIPAGSIIRRSSGGTVINYNVLTTTTAEIDLYATTIPVVSTANLPASAEVMVGSFCFTYTGKTPTELIGVSYTFAGGWGRIDSGGNVSTNSYINFQIRPGDLPTSGIHTDTITVENFRPQTYVKYRDVIVSRTEIVAPTHNTSGPTNPVWVPTTPWQIFDIPNTTWMDYLKDDGSGIAPAHGPGVGWQDHPSYQHILADGGATYSVKNKEIWLYGGGHGGSANNIVAAAAIGKDSPTWRVVEMPTPIETRLVDYQTTEHFNVNHGRHSDGKPYACHTFDHAVYSDLTDEYIVCSQFATVHQQATMATLACHKDTGWRPDLYYPDIPPDPIIRQMGVTFLSYDGNYAYYERGGSPLRRLNFATRQWDAVGNSWTTNPFPLAAHDASAAAGPGIYALWCAQTNDTTSHRAYLVNLTNGVRTLPTTTGDPYPEFSWGKPPVADVVWVPELNGWVVLYAKVNDPVNGPCEWRFMLYRQTSDTTLTATNIPVVGLPTAYVQRQSMWYDPDYQCLIIQGHFKGLGPFKVIKIGTV